MEDKLMFILFFTGVFCLVGLIFAITGFVLKCHENKKKRECFKEVWGKIIDIETHHSQHGYSYAPVYAFMIGEESVIHHSRVSSSHLPYQIGDDVKIFYDPQDYQRSYIEGDRTQSFLSLFFIVFGSIFVVVGIVVGVCVGVNF